MARLHRDAARVWRCAAVLVILARAGLACAEMSDEAYRSPSGTVPPAQRTRVEAEVQAARASEAAAAVIEAARDEARARELAAQRAQRPVGAQLLEARCSGCHVATLVEGARYGAIGWRWTVERMRWWHGAQVTMGEAALIARHLATVKPAAASRIWTERAIVLAVVVSALGIPFQLARQWRRSRHRG